MSYCDGYNKAFVILNANTEIVSINPPVDVSYEDIPPKPYKITWDSGQHIILNPDNYEYFFTYSSGSVFFELTGTDENNISGKLSTTKGLNSTKRIWGEAKDISNKIYEQGESITGRFTAYYIYFENSNGQVFLNKASTPATGSIRYKSVVVSRKILSDAVVESIHIIDGGNESEYPINDENSVQTLMSQEKCQVQISDLSGVIYQEIFEEICPIPYLINCGKRQCPEGTCCECTTNNNSVTCCYSGNGIVIDSFSNYS